MYIIIENDAQIMKLYSRQPSLIRELTKVLASAPAEMIPLSGGFPNPGM